MQNANVEDRAKMIQLLSEFRFFVIIIHTFVSKFKDIHK